MRRKTQSGPTRRVRGPGPGAWGRGWRTALPSSSQVLAVGSSEPFLRKLLFRPRRDLPCSPGSKCSVSFTPDVAEPHSPRVHCLGLLLSPHRQLVPATPRPDPHPSTCCLSFQARTGDGEEAQEASVTAGLSLAGPLPGRPAAALSPVPASGEASSPLCPALPQLHVGCVSGSLFSFLLGPWMVKPGPCH